MQSFRLLYKDQYSVYLSDSGFCILSYRNVPPGRSVLEEDCCLIFIPDGFIPDESFCRKVEAFCKRFRGKLLWVENPSADRLLWKCTGAADCTGMSVIIGSYCIHLTSLQAEAADSLTFQGSFQSGCHYFPVSGEGIRLDLSASVGSLSFSVSCRPEEDIFRSLQAGIQFVMPVSPEPETEPELELTGNFMTAFYNSLLSCERSFLLDALITPCQLTDENATFLSLPQITFQSTLLTPGGEPVNLISRTGKLVLEKTASSLSYDEETKSYLPGGFQWYWSFQGEFALADSRSQSPVRSLLPGLSGAEYLETQEAIRFIPHQNALLCPVKESANTMPSGITTSWLSFRGTYFSSSESMPLFTSQDMTNSRFLRAYIPPVSAFEAFSPSVPVLPWKQITAGKPEEIRQAEDFLYQSRFHILTGKMRQSAGNTQTASSFTAIAPCGFCVSISPNSKNWDWLGIAQTSDEALPDIRLYSITPETRLALQQKECTLLVSTARDFAALSAMTNTVTLPVDGWEIVLSETHWVEDQTLMLLKYSNASAICELLSDTPQFQYALSLAYTGDQTLRPEYQEFMTIVKDKNFQGVFLLGAAALPKQVSAEIAAITQDIEDGEIKASYTAVFRSKVSVSPQGQITVARSELSSLFTYQGKSITNESRSDRKLDFRTVGLTALIRQSVIREFDSRSELMVAELLGASLVPSCPSDGKCLVLNGCLETISGTPVFQFRLAAEISFQLPDTPISNILFDSLRMVSAPDRTEFLLSGKFSFLTTEGCDLFSYDLLPFTGIRIIKQANVFTVDYHTVSLLQESAVIRENSFAEAFGGKLSQPVLYRTGVSPDDMDFFSITTPVRQGLLGDYWNGLVWTISLGSSGELGAGGALSFEVLAAWTNTSYYTGLRLPGIFRKGFALQGLFTAGFSGIELQKKEADGTLYFRLHGFTLKMLGLTFPGNGAELLLLGKHGTIAWYTGYEEKEAGT